MTPDNSRNILNIPTENVTMDEAVREVLDRIASGQPGYVVTLNPEILYGCQKDPAVQQAVRDATFIFPDGIGIVYASKILKRPLKERVPGVELSENLLPEAVTRGYRLFILGGEPGVAEQAASKLTEKYPGLQVCGTSDGFFTDDDVLTAKITAAAPDILFVCLGASLQERWMAAHIGRIPSGVMLGIGGSVDIYAGTVTRAPLFWRKLNLEWFYRVLSQPKRFGRIVVSLPSFLWAVLRQRRAERKAEKKPRD